MQYLLQISKVKIMSIISKIAAAILPTSDRVNQYSVLFGHECAGLGEHGSLTGTWVKEGNRNDITIPFYFEGMMLPPRIDVDVIKELFYHARRAGIVPTHVYSYGNMAPVRSSPNPVRAVVEKPVVKGPIGLVRQTPATA